MSKYNDILNEYYFENVLNEAYVGKTEALLEIEKAIHELRKNHSYFTEINNSKEMLKINRLFEKQFGMDIFCLSIVKDDVLNGYTYGISSRFDIIKEYRESLRDLVTIKDGGYYYAQPNKIAVMVTLFIGFLTNEEFTDAEILAIILHEIGHNFSNCIYNKLYKRNRSIYISYEHIYKSLIILSAIASLALVGIPYLIMYIKEYNLLTNKGQRNKAKKTKRKHPITGWLRGFWGGVMGKVDNAFLSLTEYLNRRFGTGVNKQVKEYTKGKEKSFTKDFDRVDEVMADKFAGIYGYGPELLSALNKMDRYMSDAAKKAKAKNEKGNNDYTEAILYMSFVDCHPATIQRANAILNTLKKELKSKNLDPKYEAAIKSQIEDMEKMLDEISTIKKKMDSTEKVINKFNKMIKEKYPNGLDQEIEDEIDDCFDEILYDTEKKYAKKYKK